MKNNINRLLFFPILSMLLVSCNKTTTSYEYNVVDKIKLVSNNVSDYQLVIPNSQNEYIGMAVSEFTNIMEMASNASFVVIDESVKAVDKSLPYISFGNTSLSAANNVTMPNNQEYLNSGYYLLNKDNNVYILADENYDLEGILYGTY